jgi:DNA-binding NarL/FixJ family response regulator
MKPTKALRILLVEDDELFRLGLTTRLQQQPDLQIVAEATDGETAVELVNQYLPDVVLLDIGLPGIGGIESCRQIKLQHPHLPILVLTSHSQKSLIERLISLGVNGYCLKGIESESLILALRSVAVGASWWDSYGTKEIYATFNQKPDLIPNSNDEFTLAKSNLTLLTPRELEILALIGLGKTNQEIATHLGIATGTVRVHVHAILQKIELRDRTQAAIFCTKVQLQTS